MLFHSSIRKELGRSFGATLVVLVTVVMTMTLLRTLGEASRGTFNPADVMIIMGYTVLSDMPTILSMSLFISVLSVVTRMYRDSEMVIWFGSGRGLLGLVRPLLRFAWPVLVVILALAFLILPWSFSKIEDLRDKYDKRGDIARIEPGQFQESGDGARVFFIEKDRKEQQSGKNVFIATHEADKETITSARKGTVEAMNGDKFLVLQSGQRLERNATTQEMTLSTFERYGVRVGADNNSARDYAPSNAKTTVELLESSSPQHQGELSWRAGLVLAAFNLIWIGLAAAGANPRAGRSTNLVFAFLAFVVYFNLLVLAKNWVENSKIELAPMLLQLHGGVFLLSMLWLAKRHFHWTLRLRRHAGGKRKAA
nr:LPS export ABC transporter permease LptF [uncultured Rhodoferax sp.]